MLPKVVLHNSVSLDESLTNFQVNMELHYQIAGNYNADAHLIGSKTMTAGFELFNEPIPEENKSDFEKPNRSNSLPYWVTVDSKGILQGVLHACRRLEYSRDIIVLITEETPQEYVEYLQERNYHFHVVGKKHVDLKCALELLSQKYGVKTVLADTGRVLGNLLLNQSLVTEISLLVHPVIVGPSCYGMFLDSKNLKLNLIHNETFDKKYVWLVYTVEKEQ
ncbi:MAG: dihydrofolate reductase family protein [Candidatus Bathyarchaeota archaeon]|nr:dihydrofolate reductase family protein [Candidatus Bathyarchaeum tardum]WGM90512.1 MAG: dihydrofolate reductase family protein [Candidatus Bathyarchaeum tardum]